MTTMDKAEMLALAERISDAQHCDCFEEAFLPGMTPFERDMIVRALRFQAESDTIDDKDLAISGLNKDWNRMLDIAHEARISSINRATENTALRRALTELLNRYVEMVESGDCGFWNQEEEKCVIDARAALALNVGGTLQSPPKGESLRRMAQGYADFWSDQSGKNESRREHYEVIASQFQRIANECRADASPREESRG